MAARLDLVARVKQAERRDIATAWTTVGGPTADPVTAYAAAGAATDRIGLGTAVTPTYPRHPITLAAQAIAINDLAPGRLRLGVGTSHKPIIEGAYGLPMGKPLAHLREYVTILRTLLWEGAVDFSGDYFTVKTALPAGVPAPRIPVPISALRPNAFRLAGEIADGAISWVTPIDYLTQTALPAAAGRGGGDGAPAPALDRARAGQRLDRSCRGAGGVPGAVSDLPQAAVLCSDVRGRGLSRHRRRRDDGRAGRDPGRLGWPQEIRDRLEAIRARGIDELMVSHVVVADEEAELAVLSEILAGE